MNKIERLIKELCPNGVEWEEIGKIIDYEQPTKYLVSSKEYNDNYELPVLTAGQTFILGYTNETEGIYQASKENPVIIFDDFTTSKKWVDFNFKVKSTAMKILKVKSGVSNILIRYVWHYLGTITYSPDQHGRQWISTYSKFKIPIPPLEIQEEIVKILDKFTDYVTELTTELTLRQKQYHYYRNKLLSFDNQFYKVEWKTLESISISISTGVTPKKSNHEYYVGGTIPWLRTNEVRNNEITKTDMFVTEKALKETSIKWISKNSVIVAISGATAGRVGINKIPLTTNQHCCCLTIDSSLANYKYVFYWLLNKNEDILELKQGARGDLNMGIIKKLSIPIPSLEIQSRIVQVLDNFDAVCNDLNIGLPKEIELRQKQYEFFRDKLLTFAAEGVYTDSTVQYRQDIIRLLQWVFGPIKVKLGSIAHCISGATPKTSESHYWFDGTIPWMSSGEVNKGFVYETEKYISQEGYDSCSTKLVPKDTVVIALAGQGKTRGTVAVTKIELCTNQSLCSIITDSSINSHFLYYYLKGQYTNLRELSSGDGTRGGLNLSMIKGLIIPLPPVDMQNSIVKILDNFEKIINDLETGLPKEIELRQKQYEFYRNKLLSFD